MIHLKLWFGMSIGNVLAVLIGISNIERAAIGIFWCAAAIFMCWLYRGSHEA